MTRNLCGGAGRATRRYRALRCGLVLAVVAAALILTPTSYAEGRCGTHPWCDTSLSPDERAMLLLGAMSQSDKIAVLTGKEASDVAMPPAKWPDGAAAPAGLGPASNPPTAWPPAMASA